MVIHFRLFNARMPASRCTPAPHFPLSKSTADPPATDVDRSDARGPEPRHRRAVRPSPQPDRESDRDPDGRRNRRLTATASRGAAPPRATARPPSEVTARAASELPGQFGTIIMRQARGRAGPDGPAAWNGSGAVRRALFVVALAELSGRFGQSFRSLEVPHSEKRLAGAGGSVR